MMYVDESGDPGTHNSPSKFFVLSALVLHESNWQNILDDFIGFRRELKRKYGLKMTEEIHASEFINGRPKTKVGIPRNLRLEILKRCLQWLDTRTDVSVFSVRCDKSRGGDIFEWTWSVLIQRFENTLNYNNFPNGNGADKGIIIADNTDGGKLTKLIRRMRRVNSIPSKFGTAPLRKTLRAVVEDPIMRNSANSYFHQLVDVVAYCARQHYEPNKYMRTKGGRTFYVKFLTNVSNKYVILSNNTPNKIVEV